MKRSNPIVLAGAALLATLIATTNALAQPEASLVYPGDDGKLVYEKHANIQESNADNIVIDYSHCGYMQGGVAFTNVPVKITLYPQFGDDQQRIQDAIDYVSGLEPDKNGYRGAVLLKAGTYELGAGLLPNNDALQIKKSGVVLRGEGQGSDGTILVTAYETKHRVIATRPERPAIGHSNTTRISDAYVGSGVSGFHVEEPGSYKAGDTIVVRFTPNQTWLDDIYVNNYMQEGDLDWTTGTYTINYERIITSVTGDSITIHSPVILPMQTRFGGGEIAKRTFTRKRLNRVGVENMRIIGTGITPTCPADDPNRLETAIHYEYTENSWIRGITVLHTSNSLFKLWDSHYITAEDCASLEPLGPKRAGYRYTFYIDAASSHNLCQRTYTDDGRHDYVLGPRIPGPNVFLDGVSQRGGTQGPHQRWATGTLFDNLKLESLIALEHRGTSGSGHGWAGIQSTIWNTESPNIICDAPVGHLNYAIGNTGTEILSGYINNTMTGVYRGHYDSHGTHVAPRSLYLKQLEDRLGNAVENIAIPEQLQGTIYELLLDWKGNGQLTETGQAQLAAPGNLSLSDLSSSGASKFIELQWTDQVPDETQFILERSVDGGTTFTELAALPANTVLYRDEDIAQNTYHYKIKAVNETLESNYIYLYVDLFDEAFYADITFQVNMKEVPDMQQDGKVWVADNTGARFEMSDPDADSIYVLTRTFVVGKNVVYKYAYQNGPDTVANVITETITGDCTNGEGFRFTAATDEDAILDPVLFGKCDVALPPGEDFTDLEGTIIIGSNEDEPWIDGDNGAGSPPGETVDKLIDNDVNTKYLVRAVSSWVEIKTNRYTKLSGYTITSANDMPSRDPRDWRIRAWDTESGRWQTLHTVTDNPPWEERFKIRVWNIDNDEWYYRYRLDIVDINGNTQNLMQMAELQLFGEVGEPTGSAEQAVSQARVYPVPAADHLYIESNDLAGNVLLEVFDITGKRIYTENRLVDGASPLMLNVASWEPGMYFLRINDRETRMTAKILVDR